MLFRSIPSSQRTLSAACASLPLACAASSTLATCSETPNGPEFGVSEHVASVLLAAQASGSDAHAALNVRCDDGMVDAFADAGLSAAEFDADDPVEAAVRATVDARPGADVVYQTGGFGVEPVAYLLGADAVTVAETARRLV